MQAFRELIKGWLGKILLGVVVLVFGAFGTESLLSIATRPQPSAEVNGEPIPQALVERTMELQRQQLRQRFGNDVDPTLLDAERLRPIALDALINKSLLVQYAQESDFGVSKESIAMWIMAMPQFQQDGVFSEDLYNRTVARLGYSPRQLEEELMKDYVVTQVRNMITQSAFLTSTELESMAKLESQTRDLGYLILDHQRFLPEVEYTDEELKSYYDKNPELFKVEEQVKLEYLEFNSDDFLEEAISAITEDDLTAAYEEDIELLSGQEERQASHILIEINDEVDEAEAKKQIEAVQAKLQAGQSFAEVAKSDSKDIGSAEEGGDLGFAKRGDFVGPFEDVLYQLEKGEVSEPVKTEFGYHIIKLVDVKQPEIPTFESQKKVLADRLAVEIAEERHIEIVEKIAEAVFNASDLGQASETLGKTVQTSDWISRSGQSNGLFSEQDVLEAAFSDEVVAKEFNSEVIELSPKRAVVLRKVEYQPESQKSYDSVREEIIQIVQQEKAIEMTKEKGQAVIAKLKHGATDAEVEALVAPYLRAGFEAKKEQPVVAETPEEDIAKSDQVEGEAADAAEQEVAAALGWKVEEKVGRFSSKVNRDITDALFKLDKPKQESGLTFGGAQIDEKDYAIVKLMEVHVPDSESLEQESKMLSRFLTYQFSQFEQQSFVDQLRNDSDIQIN